MHAVELVLIILGLSLFEVISSIDNAVINAEVLGTMSERARKWFLLWGMLVAVFLVRGLLPFLILWMSNPQMGAGDAFRMMVHPDPGIMAAVEKSAPVLLAGGGTFLVFLFFHWFFLEPKNYGLRGERFALENGVWFYAVVSVLLSTVVWFAIQRDPPMAFGAVVGSTAFFITHGFKENAARMEERMLHSQRGMSDLSKLLYLEVIDATFSIDGVLGAFAFTFAIPLILLGNGIGALVVRQLTLRNIDQVRKYKYLKNGAMYSILGLGSVMVLESFGLHVPAWLSPVLTFLTLGWFLWKSVAELGEARTGTA